MATRKPTDTQHTDPLPGEDEMARVYRAAAQDAPPASPDARMLAKAKPKARGPFGGRWAIPLSTTAVIVLSLGVLMLLSEPGVLTNRDASVLLGAAALPETPARSAAPAPTLPAAEAPAALSATPETKKTERAATAPAAAPMQRERIAEERVATARDDARAKNKLAKEAGGMSVMADVIAVQASGQPGAYQFNVGIRSLDKGCAQYADWWEVVNEDGKLLYRRVLLHSHVDEQPFTRSGGPVPIQTDTVVWVRAHMNTGGYGGMAFKGSVKAGFKQAVPDAGFAAGLAKQAPLPAGCDF
jgi:hypothetical protein